MSNVLQFPPQLSSQPLLSKLDFESVPIISQALFLLRRAGVDKGIKLTANANLGRSFVQDFWNEKIRPYELHPFKPYKEDECPEVIKVFTVLDAAGLIGSLRNHAILSKEGRTLLESADWHSLYEALLTAYISDWNWGFGDRYADFEEIQDLAPELINDLRNWTKPTIRATDLFERNFMVQKIAKSAWRFSDESPKDYAIRCFKLRFCDRFAVPFGLLTDPSGDPFDFSPKKIYVRTKFLELMFVGSDERDMH